MTTLFSDINAFLFTRGFGNAAGLLAQYGLMSGRSRPSTQYSSDSDSDTDEYKELEPNVNPVTGLFQLFESCCLINLQQILGNFIIMM